MGKEVSRGSTDSKSLSCWLATRSTGRCCGGGRGRSFASPSSVRSRSWSARILPVAFSVALIRVPFHVNGPSSIRGRCPLILRPVEFRLSRLSVSEPGGRSPVAHHVMAFNQGGVMLVYVSSFHRFVAFILGFLWHGWHFIRSRGSTKVSARYSGIRGESMGRAE